MSSSSSSSSTSSNTPMFKMIEGIDQMRSYFNFDAGQIRNYLDWIVMQITYDKKELDPVGKGILTLQKEIIWYILQAGPKDEASGGLNFQELKASLTRYKNGVPDPVSIACFWDPAEEIPIAEVCTAIGYILSATVLHPSPPTARFYFSLLAMYAKWCATISASMTFPINKRHRWICPPPSMCSMMYVIDRSKQVVNTILLGSTMNGSWGGNAKMIYDNIRKPFMKTIYPEIDSLEAPMKANKNGQVWGKCAETYPFRLLVRFCKKFDPKAPIWIYGKSIRTGEKLEWVKDEKIIWGGIATQSDIPDLGLITKIPICAMPCQNCTLLIKKLAPEDFTKDLLDGFTIDLDPNHWGMEMEKTEK